MSDAVELFDSLKRLHDIARWAGDDASAETLRDAAVLIPVLMPWHADVLSSPDLPEFWSRVTQGALDETTSRPQTRTRYERLRGDAIRRFATAQKVIHSLRPPRPARDAAHGQQSRDDELVRRAALRLPPELPRPPEGTAGAPLDTDSLVRRAQERFGRASPEALSDAEIHSAAFLHDSELMDFFAPDQIALWSGWMLDPDCYDSMDRRWKRVRALPAQATTSILWTVGNASHSPAVRICGYSLTGYARLQEAPPPFIAVASDPEDLGPSSSLYFAGESLSLKISFHPFAGVARGAAVSRSDDARTRAGLWKLLATISKAVTVLERE